MPGCISHAGSPVRSRCPIVVKVTFVMLPAPKVLWPKISRTIENVNFAGNCCVHVPYEYLTILASGVDVP